jgi:predicted ATPase/DNA-binding SARP family transcriptional activator
VNGGNIEFFLLGKPCIRLDGRPLSFSRRKTAALLFYLACRAEPLGRSAAAGLLWPESPPERARQSLRQALLDAAAVAGRPLVEGEGRFLRAANGMAMRTDTAAFTAKAEQGISAAKADPQAARRALLEAELAYRGEFLEGFYLDDSLGFEEWQLEEAERLRCLGATVSVTLARLALEEGEAEEAEAKARRAIEIAPLFEAGHCLLAEALTAAGNITAARVHARTYAGLLAKDGSLKPGPAFTELMAELEGRSGTPSQGHADARQRPRPAFVATQALPRPGTSFIGRQDQLSALAGLLKAGALVCLWGTGGIGKTRLAIEAASLAASGFEEGAAFVDLVPCARDDDVAAAVATALGLRLAGGGASRLGDYLAARKLLLLLDNCEHVLEGAVSTASQVLAACPGMAVLATSRRRLGIPGELAFEVPPLAAAEASLLLSERSRAALPGWEPGEADEADLSAICARLDSLPLAIELAATRVGQIGPRAMRCLLEARLEAPLDLLEDGLKTQRGAHRALRALFEWSWETLDEGERRTLARLSVFRGSFSLDAGVAVCGHGSESLILGLVDKSLLTVRRLHGATPRFALLETIKAYATERLAARGWTEAARRAHVAWYASLAEGLEPSLIVLRDPGVLQRGGADLDEFEAAMRYAIKLEGQLGAAAGLMRALYRLFSLCGAMGRYASLMEAIGERAGELEGSLALADLRFARGIWLQWEVRNPEGRTELEAAAQLYRAAGNRSMEGYSLANIRSVRDVFDEADPTCSCAERALAIFTSMASTHGMALALLSKAWGCLTSREDLEGTEKAIAAGLPLARETGDMDLLSGYYMCLTGIAFQRHDLDGGMRHLDACEHAGHVLDDPTLLADVAFYRASAAYAAGDAASGLASALAGLGQRRRCGQAIQIAAGLRIAAVGLDLLGEVDRAIELEREALALAIPTKSPDEIAMHRMSIALLEARRGNPEVGLQIIEDMVAVERAASATGLRPRTLLRLGRYKLAIGDRKGASAAFHELAGMSGAPEELALGARLHLCILGEPCIAAGDLLDLLRKGIGFQDDGQAGVALAMASVLADAGIHGLALELASRAAAFRACLTPYFWSLPERMASEAALERLRGILGAETLDPAVEAALKRYSESRNGFFQEVSALLPGLSETCTSLDGRERIHLQVKGRAPAAPAAPTDNPSKEAAVAENAAGLSQLSRPSARRRRKSR